MSFRKAFMLASILLAGAAAVCSAEPGRANGSVAPSAARGGHGSESMAPVELDPDLPGLAADPDLDHPPGPMPGRPMGMGLGMRGRALMGELDLTPAQREHIAERRDRQMRERIQKSAEIRIAELDLRSLMRAEKPDGRAIDEQIDRIAGLRADLQKTQVRTMLEIRSMLTPQQREKLRDLRMRGGRRIQIIRRPREGRDL